MSIVVTPIPKLIDLTAPAFTLGTANAAGSAITAVASDSTLLAFDTTVPSTNTYAASSAAGSAVVASRRDHVHGMPANPSLVSTIVSGTRTASAGAGDQTITGFGFDPTTVHVMLQKTNGTVNGSYAWGDDDADEKAWAVVNANQTIQMYDNVAFMDVGTSDTMRATLSSYITDGIIITWAVGGVGISVSFSILGMR